MDTKYQYYDPMDAMIHQTNTLNAFNNYHSACLKFAKIENQKSMDAQIEWLRQWLSQFCIPEIVNAPARPLEFNFNSLPFDLIKTIVAIRENTGWDEFSCFIGILTATALASWGRFTVAVNENSWRVPVIMHTNLISNTGSCKSAFIAMLKRPFSDFENRKIREYGNALLDSDVADAQLKTLKNLGNSENKALTKDWSKSGGRDFNALMTQVEALTREMAPVFKKVESMRPKPSPSLFFGDCTEKGIVLELDKQGECKIDIDTEGGLLLKMLDGKSGFVNLMLKAYDREEHIDSTARRIISLKNPVIGYLIATQPHIAGKFYQSVTAREGGLSPRSIPVFAAKMTTGLIHEECNLTEYASKINQLLSFWYTQDAAREFFDLKLTPDADAMIRGFMLESEGMITLDNHHLEPFLHKLRGHACRFAGALHLWTHPQTPQSEKISWQTMALAIEAARAVVPHADHAFSPNGFKAYNDAEKALAWIRNHGHTKFSVRDFCNSTGWKKDRALPALEVVARHRAIGLIYELERIAVCVANPNIFRQPAVLPYSWL